jgi:Uncharacterized conserved protein (DUF2285)
MPTSDILADLPTPDEITPYDQAHLVTYLRLLDAETEGAPWEEAAKIVLGLDPDQDRPSAERTYQSHLNRAKWMTTNGYAHLLKMS